MTKTAIVTADRLFFHILYEDKTYVVHSAHEVMTLVVFFLFQNKSINLAPSKIDFAKLQQYEIMTAKKENDFVSVSVVDSEGFIYGNTIDAKDEFALLRNFETMLFQIRWEKALIKNRYHLNPQIYVP